MLISLAVTAVLAGQTQGTLVLADLPSWSNLTDCSAETPRSVPCRITDPPPTADQRLGTGSFAMWAGDDTLHLVWRAPNDSILAVSASVGLQLPLSRIAGSSTWALSLVLPGATRAVITVHLYADAGAGFIADSTIQFVWRGPDAPPPPPAATVLAGTRTADSIWSDALAMWRGVEWYVPAGVHDGDRVPVVYLGDGQNVRGWSPLVDTLITMGVLPPVALVGAYSAGLAPGAPMRGIQDDPRAVEYLIEVAEGVGADSAAVATRFRNHTIFFTEELIDWAERTLLVATSREGRAVAGVSNSAFYARTLAITHPGLYGAVIALSHNGPALPTDYDNATAPAYFVAAGLLERRIAPQAERFAADLEERGIPHHLVLFPSGHDPSVWKELIPQAVRWWLAQAR